MRPLQRNALNCSELFRIYRVCRDSAIKRKKYFVGTRVSARRSLFALLWLYSLIVILALWNITFPMTLELSVTLNKYDVFLNSGLLSLTSVTCIVIIVEFDFFLSLVLISTAYTYETKNTCIIFLGYSFLFKQEQKKNNVL